MRSRIEKKCVFLTPKAYFWISCPKTKAIKNVLLALEALLLMFELENRQKMFFLTLETYFWIFLLEKLKTKENVFLTFDPKVFDVCLTFDP